MTTVTLYKFTYTPFEKGPIRSADYFIVAENRKQAEIIALNTAHKFLDESHTVQVSEILKGYREK